MVVVCINTHNTIIPFDPFHLVHLTPLYTPPAAAAAALAPFPPHPFFLFLPYPTKSLDQCVKRLK